MKNLVLCLGVENASNSVLYFDSEKYRNRILSRFEYIKWNLVLHLT